MDNIEIVYKNVKNLSIRLKDKNLLLVTCPYNTSKKTVLNFVDKYSNKFLNSAKKLNQLYDLDSQNKWILIFGQKHNLEIISNPSMKKKYQLLQKDNGNIILNYKNDFLAKEFYIYFLNSIKDEFSFYINKVFMDQIKIIGLENYQIIFKIKNVYRIWGSCNYQKNIITFNSALIHMEKDIIKYVIIHELCHILKHNHSKDFWNLVYNYDNNFKTNRKKLKGFIISKP